MYHYVTELMSLSGCGIPQHLLRQLQSVMNAAARLIYLSSRFDYILRSSVNFTGWRQRNGLTSNSQYLCSNVYTGLRLHTSPMNLVVQLILKLDADFIQQSASSSILVVHRTRLTTVGDRSFPVAASRVRNNLPHHVIRSPTLQVF